MIDVTFIIPAYNEQERIVNTLKTVQDLPVSKEVIVINDGSTDETELQVRNHADHVISFTKNKGKGCALQAGWKAAKGTYIICLDADLEESAKDSLLLLDPLLKKRADLTISVINRGKGAGFGFVKRRVQNLVFRETGMRVEAPLSGQRAFHRKWLPVLLKHPYYRFGVETQMTIDLLRAGAVYEEVVTSMTHREMGKSIKGFLHRLKQWKDIEKQCRGAQP